MTYTLIDSEIKNILYFKNKLKLYFYNETLLWRFSFHNVIFFQIKFLVQFVSLIFSGAEFSQSDSLVLSLINEQEGGRKV